MTVYFRDLMTNWFHHHSCKWRYA